MGNGERVPWCEGSSEYPEYSVGDKMAGTARCRHCGRVLKLRFVRSPATGRQVVQLPNHKRESPSRVKRGSNV
jgi:hypothetical protein